jgi:hypothetical protein
MKLSDAGLRRRPTRLLDPNHRLPPWLTEDDTPRDRSNRLLDATIAQDLEQCRGDQDRVAQDWLVNLLGSSRKAPFYPHSPRHS